MMHCLSPPQTTKQTVEPIDIYRFASCFFVDSTGTKSMCTHACANKLFIQLLELHHKEVVRCCSKSQCATYRNMNLNKCLISHGEHLFLLD